MVPVLLTQTIICSRTRTTIHSACIGATTRASPPLAGCSLKVIAGCRGLFRAGTLQPWMVEAATVNRIAIIR
jgi:hypothetical protein